MVALGSLSMVVDAATLVTLYKTEEQIPPLDDDLNKHDFKEFCELVEGRKLCDYATLCPGCNDGSCDNFFAYDVVELCDLDLDPNKNEIMTLEAEACITGKENDEDDGLAYVHWFGSSLTESENNVQCNPNLGADNRKKIFACCTDGFPGSHNVWVTDFAGEGTNCWHPDFESAAPSGVPTFSPIAITVPTPPVSFHCKERQTFLF